MKHLVMAALLIAGCATTKSRTAGYVAGGIELGIGGVTLVTAPSGTDGNWQRSWGESFTAVGGTIIVATVIGTLIAKAER